MANRKIAIILFLILIILANLYLISGACGEDQININTASAEDLDKIIWVGPITAQEIINLRLFNSVDDLINVPGIGEIKLQDIKDEGLACVENSKEDEEEEDEDSEGEDMDEGDEEAEEDDDDYFKSNEIESQNEAQPKIQNNTLNKITLNPKDINTDSDKESLRNDYAIYGLGIFSVLIIILFTLKFLRYRKNEFRRKN